MNVADIVQSVSEAKAAGKIRKVNNIKMNNMNKPQNEGFLMKPSVKEVVIPTTLTSLNKTGTAVTNLQKSLAFLDYSISLDEFVQKRFGKTTLDALNKFQAANKIPVSARFDTESRKLLVRVLHEKDRRIEKAMTYTVKGSVHSTEGIALTAHEVTLKVFGIGRSAVHTRTTNSKGFYNIPFEGPKDASGKALTSFTVKVEVKLQDSNKVISRPSATTQQTLTTRGLTQRAGMMQASTFSSNLQYSKTITVKSAITWCNFGKYCPTSELDLMKKALCDRLGVQDALSLFYPTETMGSGQVSSLASVPVYQVQALSLVAKMFSIVSDIQAKDREKMISDVLYAIVRQDVPEGLIEYYNLLKYSKFGNTPPTESQMEAALTGARALLDKMVLAQLETLSKAISQSITDNIIDQRLDPVGMTELFATFRKQYVLDHMELKPGVTLRDILSVSTVIPDKYLSIAECYVGAQDLGSAFLATVSPMLTASEREDLERSLTILEFLHFNISAAKAVKADMANYHLGRMAMQPNSYYSSKGIARPSDILPAIRSAYLEHWFVYSLQLYLDDVKSWKKSLSDNVPAGSEAYRFITETVAGAITPLSNAMVIRADARRFDFSDMAKTNNYQFVSKEETEKNEDCKRGVRALQRLYKISPSPQVAQKLLAQGITSAVEAYYAGQENLSIGKKAWASVKDIYLKTLSLYDDLLDATRRSSDSVTPNSANLRRLFGSLDTYYYDDSLSLLSPAAYLADLLRFLQNRPTENGSSAYGILTATRPEIPFILLNKKNSETLVPQIDLVCEALEMAVHGSGGWKHRQTEGEGEEPLLVPEHTEESVYRTLSTSGQPACHPYFNLAETQVREFMRALGVERHELMAFYGRPRFEVAREYFEMSAKEAAVFSTGGASTWKIKTTKSGNLTLVPLLHFMNAADLSYSDSVQVLGTLGIVLSDPDPEGLGYPDITRQDILLNDSSSSLLRLQRFVILLKRTGLSVSDLAACMKDPAVCGGELDEKAVVALMDVVLARRKAEDGDTDEGVMEEFPGLSEEEVRIILEHNLDGFPSLPERDDLCEVIAASYSVDPALLESLSEKWELDQARVETAASCLLTAAILNSTLSATREEILLAESRFGREWSRENLSDIIEIISFNRDYKLNGEEPIAVDPDMTAADCRHARAVFSYLEKLGLPAEADLSALAHFSDYATEAAKAGKLLAALRERFARNTAKIRTTMDRIRVQKRDALTGYLLAEKFSNAKDREELVNSYLLDVGMGPEQETTRIKMATNSVQLFVQRCMLGLEPLLHVNASATNTTENWSQWAWLKNYRVWEASRKIFLFPENWIDPELRDDQTPEFKEFLTEIEGDETSSESMETALLNYLYALDEIARLDVCGLYRQTVGTTDMIHVLARTRDDHSIYYYRYYDNVAHEWSPWEKLDIEIEGDQVVPVIYNRRLYIFWLKFMQKTMKVEKLPGSSSTQDDSDAPEPANYHEIQLVWTFRKEQSWTPPKTGKMKLIHPWNRPRYAYDLKPFIDKDNRLHLDVYLSSAKEFNGVLPKNAFDYYPSFQNRYSAHPFDERSRPWHSSTFIFEGDVTDVLLKDIQREDPLHKDQRISSYDFVHSCFGEDGALIKKLENKLSGPSLITPEGMHLSGNRLVNDKDIFTPPNPDKLHTLEVNHTFYDKLVRTSILKTLIPDDDRTQNLRFRRDMLDLELQMRAVRPRLLLSNAHSPFELVMTQQYIQMNSMGKDSLMFYQDGKHSLYFTSLGEKEESFVVEYDSEPARYGSRAHTTESVQVSSKTCQYSASLFYHPYVKMFIKNIREGGIDKLYQRELQLEPWSKDIPSRKSGDFFGQYKPSSVVTNSPSEMVDFDYGGAYSVYNWELFFHIPLTIACRLSENNKYEEAMRWFHFIFNPMAYVKNSASPEGYWTTKPFYENTRAKKQNSDKADRIESLLDGLGLNDPQLRAWRNNPFSPHLVARYRTSAYQKTVVTKYIANMIAWADMLFKEETMESINEATLLYVLAYEILGTRPQKVKSPVNDRHDKDFNTLRKGITAFGNTADKGMERLNLLLEIESLLNIGSTADETDPTAEVPHVDVYYFDMPQNDLIEQYWDTIEDRLRKIRASQNIDGVFRKLSINAPEIDPADLVKAAASGGGLDSIGYNKVSSTQGQPPYRFRVALSLAEQMCNEVRMIGEKMLSATEKYEAEDMAKFRAAQEKDLLNAMVQIREQEIKEIETSISSLEETLARAERTQEYYADLQAISDKEAKAIRLNEESLRSSQIAVPINSSGAMLAAAGNLLTGAAGLSSPIVGYIVSFEAIGQSLMMQANSLQMSAGMADRKSAIVGTNAVYERRASEWALQAELAGKEAASLAHQIAGAEHRLSVARMNLDNQRLQIEQSNAVLELLKTKKSSAELYRWMRSQLASVYKTAYNLAFELAKKAESCFEWELGTKPGIIQMTAWNSKYDGFLAGDLLMQQIHKLQDEYWKSNVRTLELTKHIPISCIPSSSETGSALLDLIYDEQCDIELPEWLFDMDYQDHYFRRIKHVSLTIPCLVGPYTNVNCQLSLTGHAIRKNINAGEKNNAPVFENVVAGSIATSTAVNDGGQFQVDFNDERYLPFEGFGAVSRWHLDLPGKTNHFDRTSISDVILNVSYTSRKETTASAHGRPDRKAVLVISLKREFQAAWRELSAGADKIRFQIPESLYPYWMRSGTKQIDSVMSESQKKLSAVGGEHLLSGDGFLDLDFSMVKNRNKLADVKIVIGIML